MQLSAAGQAVVAMGEVGVTASDPDMAALDVLGDVLNSFGGRLFDRIRSREVLRFVLHHACLCATKLLAAPEKAGLLIP